MSSLKPCCLRYGFTAAAQKPNDGVRPSFGILSKTSKRLEWCCPKALLWQLQGCVHKWFARPVHADLVYHFIFWLLDMPFRVAFTTCHCYWKLSDCPFHCSFHWFSDSVFVLFIKLLFPTLRIFYWKAGWIFFSKTYFPIAGKEIFSYELELGMQLSGSSSV